LCRRPVELLAKRFQLVTRPDLDAVAQIPRADPGRPRLQCPDGSDHAPGEKHAREDREHEAEHKEDGAADHRGLKRRERLAERLLDEHELPERLDGSVRGEEPPTLEAGRDRADALIPAGTRSPCRADLGQRRQIPLL
jgi:hypothetical protein